MFGFGFSEFLLYFVAGVGIFWMVSFAIGRFITAFSGRRGGTDEGAGFLFVFLFVLPLSVGLATGTYYGVQSAIALVVERIEVERQHDGAAPSSEQSIESDDGVPYGDPRIERPIIRL